ncbi:MAG: nucleotide modification associated domain-containing protein, partial [Bacteroidota bacterium]
MSHTKQEYNSVLSACREVFIKKNDDYGTSWRLFRPSSLTDQIYIKAQRIRNIEESGKNAVGDDDQSVYAFQGAKVSNMLDFAKCYDEGLKT